MHIYDCFPFYNELDLLEIRLNELNDVVDFFVLVEAERTHQNKPKKLFYKEACDEQRFSAFKHKIIHIIVSESEFTNDAWQNERLQRAKILQGLESAADDDAIIVSDLDEIPSREAVQRAIQQNKIPCVFEQKLHYAYLNTQLFIGDTCINNGSVILSKHAFAQDPECVRKSSKNNYKHITSGGWHFSFLGNVDHIYNKLQNYAHTEFSHITRESIEQAVKNLSDILSRPGHVMKVEQDISYLPQFVVDNVDKFSKYILQ